MSSSSSQGEREEDDISPSSSSSVRTPLLVDSRDSSHSADAVSSSGPLRRVVLFAKPRPSSDSEADAEGEISAATTPNPVFSEEGGVGDKEQDLDIDFADEKSNVSLTPPSSTSPKYFIPRLCRILPLLRPCSFSSLLLLLCLILASFGTTLTFYITTQTQSDLFLLFDLPFGDPNTWTRIWRILVRVGLLAVLGVVFPGILLGGMGGSGSSGVVSGAGALVGVLGWVWRRDLTKSLLGRVFSENTKNKNDEKKRKNVSRVCYLLMCRSGENGIDNVDQRIESDAREWVVNASSVWVGIVTTVVQICVNTGLLCWNRFFWLLIPTFVWPFVNVVVYTLLIAPLSRTIFQKDRLEGDFRFVHARIREFAESIAFFSNRFQQEENDVTADSVVEKQKAETTFSKLVKTLLCLAGRFGALNLWMSVAFYTPTVLYILSLMPMVFYFVSPFAAGMSTAETSKIMFLAYTLANATSNSISSLFNLSRGVSVVMGDTARIGQMLERIDEIEEMDRERDARLEEEEEGEEEDGESSYIAMENVSVSTPNGKLLLRDVSFRLSDPRKHSLLIKGPSGSGKSSLCRLLAQLWDPSAGRVVKKNLSNIPEDIFFLPQRPYLIRGTLKDNVAYPLTKEESLCSDSALERAMELANIEYLLKRASLHMQNVFWDEKLSVGEQQRLALARVFFHRPKWVILDESTSALDPSNQEDMYTRLRELGIGIISVAHRRALLQFHDLVLTIHGDEASSQDHLGYDWTLQKISDDMIPRYDHEWEKISAFEVSVAEADTFEMEHPGQSIEISSAEVGLTGINVTLFKRLGRLLFTQMMIRPCSLWFFVAFLVVVVVLSAIAPLPLIALSGWISDAVSARELTKSLTYVVAYIASFMSVGLTIVIATFFFTLLGICFRRNLTSYLHQRYFRNRNFYKMNVLDKEIDNPDQRICQDVDALTSGFNVNQGLSYAVNHLMTNLIKLASILVMSLIFVGWYSPVISLALFLIGGIAEVAVMIFLARRTFLQQKFEGYFRISLTRIKEYGEQIAFYGGLAREREVIEEKFDRLMRNSGIQTILVVLQTFLSWILMSLGGVVAYVTVALAVYVDQEKYQNVPTMVGLIQNQSMYLQNSMNAFLAILGMGALFAQLAGTIGRVVQFAEKLDALEDDNPLDNRRDTLDCIEVKDLTVQTPLRRKLFYNLSFQVSSKDNLLVVGPSGCGKSSLLRVLCGLWPTRGSGLVAAPQHVGESGLFLLPQRPYLTLGSLKNQVIYPDEESTVPEERLLQILVDVNLAYIYDRIGSWDHSMDWGTVLSPGEQQRIGMARLIYHKPLFAILDESTSALDEENEKLMYATCEEHSITVVSVGHRRTLADFHRLRLAFDGVGSWEFSKKVRKNELAEF